MIDLLKGCGRDFDYNQFSRNNWEKHWSRPRASTSAKQDNKKIFFVPLVECTKLYALIKNIIHVHANPFPSFASVAVHSRFPGSRIRTAKHCTDHGRRHGMGRYRHERESRGIRTPNLEKIARSGARFEHFMVSPLCAPTRASLLTGRYHLRTGVANVTGGLETMRTEEVTMAEVFKKAGYATGLFGKWHNGAHYPQDPNGQGFDEFFGFCGGHWTNYFNTRLQHNHTMVETRGYITDVLTDAALDFIEKNKAHPFLCYIPYNAPDGPF